MIQYFVVVSFLEKFSEEDVVFQAVSLAQHAKPQNPKAIAKYPNGIKTNLPAFPLRFFQLMMSRPHESSLSVDLELDSHLRIQGWTLISGAAGLWRRQSWQLHSGSAYSSLVETETITRCAVESSEVSLVRPQPGFHHNLDQTRRA